MIHVIDNNKKAPGVFPGLSCYYMIYIFFGMTTFLPLMI